MRKDWVSAEEAAELITNGNGRGIKIAIIDSGVDPSHPALAGMNLMDDLAVVNDGLQLKICPGEGRDVFGHGTAVAGVIREIAPEASIGSIRVLDSDLASRTQTICAGVQRAIDLGYNILNCSFGCSIPEHLPQYKRWVDDAYLKDIHVVAACNNYDFTKEEWPGYFPSVMTVNMARTEQLLTFFYKKGHLVEFAARGVDVRVAWKDGQVKEVSGSSFAAPRVAALLARLLSEAPDLSPIAAKALFRKLARPWGKEIDAANVAHDETDDAHNSTGSE